MNLCTESNLTARTFCFTIDSSEKLAKEDDMTTTPGSGNKQIGVLLVEGGFLTNEQLQEALDLMPQQRKSLREVLAEKGWVNAETFTTFLSLHSRVPMVDLEQVQIEQAAINLVPEEVALRCMALPLAVEGDSLRVAMDNPLDTEAINILATVSGKHIKQRVSLRGNIRELIEKNYRAAPREMPVELAAGDAVSQTHVVRAVNMLIAQAVKDRASEIYVDSVETGLSIRYPIEGVLKERVRFPLDVRDAIMQQIRESEGKFKFKLPEGEVTFQVTFSQGPDGENVVLKIVVP